MRCNKSRGVKFPKICVSCQIGRVISINFEHSKKIATSNRMSRGIVGSSESFPPPPVVLVTVTIVCISSDFKPSILRRLARTVGSSSWLGLLPSLVLLLLLVVSKGSFSSLAKLTLRRASWRREERRTGTGFIAGMMVVEFQETRLSNSGAVSRTRNVTFRSHFRSESFVLFSNFSRSCVDVCYTWIANWDPFTVRAFFYSPRWIDSTTYVHRYRWHSLRRKICCTRIPRLPRLRFPTFMWRSQSRGLSRHLVLSRHVSHKLRLDCSIYLYIRRRPSELWIYIRSIGLRYSELAYSFHYHRPPYPGAGRNICQTSFLHASKRWCSITRTISTVQKVILPQKPSQRPYKLIL